MQGAITFLIFIYAMYTTLKSVAKKKNKTFKFFPLKNNLFFRAVLARGRVSWVKDEHRYTYSDRACSVPKNFKRLHAGIPALGVFGNLHLIMRILLNLTFGTTFFRPMNI